MQVSSAVYSAAYVLGKAEGESIMEGWAYGFEARYGSDHSQVVEALTTLTGGNFSPEEVMSSYNAGLKDGADFTYSGLPSNRR